MKMVMPRTAIGARLALDLINIKEKKFKKIEQNEHSYSNAGRMLKISALNCEADLFAEWKVMPIAMHGGGEDKLWCYPLPILEETKPLIRTNKTHIIYDSESKANNSGLLEPRIISKSAY